MMFRFLRKEWVVALLLSALFLAASQVSLFTRIDGWLYSFGQHLVRTSDHPMEKLAVIELDKQSLASVGGNAGERMALADVLEKTIKARPRAVAILHPLSDSDGQPALLALDELDEEVAKLSLAKNGDEKVSALIERKKSAFDANQRIANAIKRSGRVVLPLHDARPEATSLFPLEYAPRKQGALLAIRQWLDPFHESHLNDLGDFERPAKLFAEHAASLAWLSQPIDNDDVSRSFALLHSDKEGHAIAGLPLQLAMTANHSASTFKIEPGSVALDYKRLPTDSHWRGYIRLYYENDALALPEHFSLKNVLDNGFKTSELKNRVVVIASNTMLRPAQAVDGGHELSLADLTAISTANILNHDLFSRTDMLAWAELLLFLFTAMILAVVIPRLHFGLALALAIACILLLVGTTEYLLLTKQLWLQTALPVCLLLVGMVLVALRRLYDAQDTQHQNEVAQTLRQLGFAYQEQNKLELAFEAFQKLPPEPSNLEMLYNLALDFERRRRYERAVAAYRHILSHDGNFKDVIARKLNAEKMERSLSMSSGQFTASILLMPDENGLKPQLGRYEVEKELGRGAMGAVYLGRDPKIDRVVAIKTLALSQEFEADELQEVESRFFHEAAAAGRLNHPNIVTIYDAGEEHDLAYIAMEFIDGKPLSDFVRDKKLLPVETVLNIIAQVAGGLDYAAKEGIVHRDIKPGNIMYNDATGVVKIADFGIARITSSSRTKTGTILGTPSYMSPEQISSQKLDGRSDIFSLGSTMFTLLTGQKAFSADSIAALTFQITSEKHPDPTKLRPELPSCVKNIIDKALQKEPDNRYQDGMAMRRAIMRCIKNMES